MQEEYLLILAICLALTIWLEYTYKIHLYKSKKARIIASSVFFVAGTLWDTFAALRGHWFWGKGTLPYRIGLLPIEEYLLFLILPYFLLTIYKIIEKKLDN